MHKIILAISVLAFFNGTPAFANDDMSAYVKNLKPVGSGRLSFLTMDVYDAALFAPQGQWKPGEPLALRLTYLRALKGNKIADRSIEEMRGIGVTDEVRLAAWHTQMREIFPDVDDGITLTGVLNSQGETIFLKNDEEIGRIKDPGFGQAFFDIWLSEKTNEPRLRKKLLGAS
jgi:hypothetical protein